MTSNSIVPPLTEQVRQALATFDDAHNAAEVAAARYGDFKRLVGSNDAERKERKAATPPDEYNDYCIQLAQAERTHKEAAAHVERVEKNLNVLREMHTREMDRATAELNLRVADRQFEAMKLAHETALIYQGMPGNYTTHAEFRARYATPAGNGVKRATVAVDDESDLPF